MFPIVGKSECSLSSWPYISTFPFKSTTSFHDPNQDSKTCQAWKLILRKSTTLRFPIILEESAVSDDHDNTISALTWFQPTLEENQVSPEQPLLIHNRKPQRTSYFRFPFLCWKRYMWHGLVLVSSSIFLNNQF